VTVVQEVLEWQLFTLSGTPITVGTLLMAALLILVSYAISRVVQQVISSTFERQQVEDRGTLHVARRLVHYLIMLVGIGVALDTVGIQLTALFAAGAIFAVGIGFAMQNIAQNFVSGVILLIERTIKPGDVLEVEKTVVRVVQMGIRATLARTRDDEDLIIPNSVLVQSTVKNYTLRDSLYRLRVPVGVVYSSDMALVFKTLKAVADRQEWRRSEKEPLVMLTTFGNSSVDFEVSVWINDPWSARQAISKLHDAIWWALKDVGVTIAFPQLDVHFDPPVVESVRRLRSPSPATN
jgi:small-conductance mechanosensitive channel